MKSSKLIFGLAAIALSFTSCKNEKETEAQKTVDSYVVYVDSLESATPADVKMNWESIDAAYTVKMNQAETALMDIKENKEATEKLEASKLKYEAMKAAFQAELAADMPSSKQLIRNSLFGEGKIGDDMNFSWVNASNILGVYDQFVNTVQDKKDSYTREDWDEIKLMYEALDSRKNTVEKEGLSSDDNGKIASLKLKFGPMYTVNRMGAKSEEMEKAKQ
jgi:hypothetical protein